MPSRHATRRSAEVRAPRAFVFELLSDPRLLPELHPLITHVAVTSDETTDGLRRVAFDVRERVPFGPIGIPNWYQGALLTRADDPSLVEAEGYAFPNVMVCTTSRLEALPDGRTRFDQETVVTAPWLLARFVFDTATRAHDATFADVVTLAEARAATSAGTTPAGPESA